MTVLARKPRKYWRNEHGTWLLQFQNYWKSVTRRKKKALLVVSGEISWLPKKKVKNQKVTPIPGRKPVGA